MKKFRMAAILFVCALCFALAACGGGENDADMEIPSRFPEKYLDTAWRTQTAGEYLMADFENDFEYLFLGITGDSSTFGTLKMSDERATRGTQSLKVTVYGDGKFNPADTEDVWFRFDTSCELGTAVDMINDYTPYACIKFDFYNAMDESSMVRFFMQEKTYFHSFRAEPGWNSVTVPLDEGGVVRRADGGLNDLTQIMMFGFLFEKYEQFGHLQTYFIDNIRACVQL